jgi:hypothetical protein
MYLEKYQPESYTLQKFGNTELKYACYCKYSWPKPEAKRDQSCGDAYSSLLLVIPTKYCHKICVLMDGCRGYKQTCAHFGSFCLRMINLTKYLFPCNVCIHLGFKQTQKN